MDDPSPDRDNRGRFAPGNPGGPGRPLGHREKLRRAVEESITTEHVSALMRRALRSGLEGNLSATKFIVDRVCGKATEAPGETGPVAVELPKLATAADCEAALDLMTREVCAGTVSPESVRLLTDLIQTRLRAIELRVVEERLTELERSAGLVDLRRR